MPDLAAEARELVAAALQEDVRGGDITTNAIFNGSEQGNAVFLVKAAGTLCGLAVVAEVFAQVDAGIRFTPLLADGAQVTPGTIAATAAGSAASLLTAERTALNFLQRMSGIATAASRYTHAVGHTRAVLLDTRKTIPGFRLLDKYAVRCGGAQNHRFGLWDRYLIKDNHLALAGSVTAAVAACRKHRAAAGSSALIEVEITSLRQVEEAVASGADIIMLDNFSVPDMHQAVHTINGSCKTEASGGVTLATIAAIAETGVDYISVGALTHSVTALDISLEITLAGS